jgi:hypothetical protein
VAFFQFYLQRLLSILKHERCKNDCYFSDGPRITKRKKRWPIIVAEMDEVIRARVSCDRTKDGEGFCDEVVEWHQQYGMGSSSKSITDEMCPTCMGRLKNGER